MPRIRPENLNPSFPGASAEMKPLNIRTEKIIHDVTGEAGKRSLEESAQLMGERLAAIRRPKKKGEGSISEAGNISEIIKGKEKKTSEGAVTHIAVEEDAVIINASDAHGAFGDLSKAIEEFIKRKEKGENIYFNFSGDVSGGDVNNTIPCMEALASLQTRYPNAVTVEFGNGERRGTSLLMGMAQESTERFLPDLYQYISSRVDQQAEKMLKGGKIKEENVKAVKKFNFGGELMKMARLGGSEPLDPEKFNREFLNRLIKAMNAGNPELSSAINLSTEPLRAGDKERAEDYPLEMLAEAKRIFEYWKKLNSIANEQPALAIYENRKSVVLATHSGYVATSSGSMSDLVYNTRNLDQAVWGKLIHPDKGERPGSVEKYGDFSSFTPEEQGKILEKLVPPDKKVALIVGHNHGNFTERIPMESGEAVRIENCVSSGKKRAGDNASYVELDMGEMAEIDELDGAVTFHILNK